MATYYSGYSNEYRLRLDITQGTQSTANNTSVVSWTLYLLSGNKSFSVYSTYSATVNGVTSPSTTQTNVDIGFNSTVTLGSGSTTVTHNADGTKSVPFSASFKTNSPAYYGGVLITPGTMTISGNFGLTTIPRYAAITAFSASISGLTASLSWTADKTISQWRYSTNSGSSYSSWITVNAKSGSRSFSVSHSTTYGFRVQVKNSASGLITTSSTVSRTSPAPAKITAFTASINDLSANLSWTADKTISQWRYSTNSGSSYSSWITVNAKSGSTSVNVSPGSTYGFRIQVKDSETGLTTTSSTKSRTATKTPSTLTLSTTSQNVGSGITWTINESYDYTHRIRYVFGNTSGYILGSGSTMSNTSTGTWTLPTALANQIPNAKSGTGTLRIRTFYGGVDVGLKTYTFTVKVPNTTTWQPSVPSVSISNVGSRPTGVTSYVQGKSKAKVVSSSTAQGGASISSYRVVVSGRGTYYGSNVTSGTLNQSGTVTITVRATDSRGYYREKSDTITVLPYSPPKLTTYTAKRSPNDQGTNLSTGINFSISSLGDQNTKQYRIRYRPTGGTWVTLVNSTGYYSRNTTHSATDVLDVNSSYEVEFYVADFYGSVTQTRNIGTAYQLMDFNASGRGVAFGKVSELDAFELGFEHMYLGKYTKVRDNGDGATIISNNAPDGSSYEAIYLRPKGDTTNQSQLVIYADRTEFNNKVVWTDGNVEYGSNSNGQYIKFPNGTQICWHTVGFQATFTAWGNIYSFNYTTKITFPASFIEEPSLNVTNSGGYAAMVMRGESDATGITQISLARGTIADTTYDIDYVAIGRWK